MAYSDSLSNKCAKNVCKRTAQLNAENVVAYFWDTV